MAFKSLKDYNENKYKNMFILKNDGDSADVIFLYRSSNDVLVADAHYIKSADYTGYVQCCGRGCPACGKGIRTQTKLFIPLYNCITNQIEFWDRTMRFENQLQQDVFDKYPDPSAYVFKIIRHGVSGDVNTKYEIVAIARNSAMPYDQILAEHHTAFPERYNMICKDVSIAELSSMLSSSGENSAGDIPEYQPIPRATISAPGANTAVDFNPSIAEEPPKELVDDIDDTDDVNPPF